MTSSVHSISSLSAKDFNNCFIDSVKDIRNNVPVADRNVESYLHVIRLDLVLL